MIPDRDYFADKDGKLTTDMSKAAIQVGVKGCFLDERTARRYGITDTLESVNEPNAPRRVMPGAEPELDAKPAKEPEAAEAVPTKVEKAASPEKPKTEANKKPAAKKEGKTK